VQEFKVPELGENVEQGDVTRVLVKVGDTISHEQPVIELETDKATIEVPSSVAGVVKDIKVKAGDKVKVGAVILTVDDASTSLGTGNGASGSKTEGAPATEPAKAVQPRQAEPSKAEQKPDQKVLSMPRRETPQPVPAQPPAVAAPKPPSPAAQAPARQGPAEPAKAEAPKPKQPAAPASPSVRRLAREIGVDINEVHGSGAAGRISDEDVKEHARRILSSVGSALARPAGAPAPAALPDFEKWGLVERQPISNIRRKTAEHLSHAWNTIPHVTQCDKADITPMEELRSKFRKQVEQAGGNLTVTAVLVKVLAAAVKQFPQFNSSLDVENNAIVYKKYINVGVAVDTEFGLLVPVIRNADQKNITQIAVELHQLSEKARAKRLTLEEMSGGGISISNLGGIGGTYFTPIVNWPEVAILGVSRGIIEPMWRDASTGSGQVGKFEPRQLLPLSLSYDHRVIDGADAMRFLRWVVQAIEQPFLLSLLG
jgi:pyruvate dehydrogenase E2 component (dihydrolipoyllysine-residue acetyltransferase)